MDKPNGKLPEEPKLSEEQQAAEARFRDFYELAIARMYGRRLTPDEKARYNRHLDVW